MVYYGYERGIPFIIIGVILALSNFRTYKNAGYFHARIISGCNIVVGVLLIVNGLIAVKYIWILDFHVIIFISLSHFFVMVLTAKIAEIYMSDKIAKVIYALSLFVLGESVLYVVFSLEFLSTVWQISAFSLVVWLTFVLYVVKKNKNKRTYGYLVFYLCHGMGLVASSYIPFLYGFFVFPAILFYLWCKKEESNIPGK